MLQRCTMFEIGVGKGSENELLLCSSLQRWLPDAFIFNLASAFVQESSIEASRHRRTCRYLPRAATMKKINTTNHLQFAYLCSFTDATSAHIPHLILTLHVQYMQQHRCYAAHAAFPAICRGVPYIPQTPPKAIGCIFRTLEDKL